MSALPGAPGAGGFRRRIPWRAPGLAAAALAALTALAAAGCGAEPGDGGRDAGREAEPAARALALADEYVAEYFRQFPEDATEFGYPDAPTDRWNDHTPAALAAWEAKEDAWLAGLRALDAGALAGTPAATAYAYALDRLEASVARRVCRRSLWNVSPTFTGWTNVFPLVLGSQPVGEEGLRAATLARVSDTRRYLETEVANLREGVRLGITAPRSGVDAVLRQVESLLATPPAESFFAEPARRDTSPAFAAELERVVSREVYPAIARYRDYLRDEYRAAARTEVGVSANPGGGECYLGSVRHYTSLPLTAEEIHRTGVREMARIQEEMREIGRRGFGIEDPRRLLQRVREDPRYTFRSEEEVLAYATAAVRRAEREVSEWFGVVPDAEVEIRPFPAFQKASGGAFYSAGAPGAPGLYQLGTYAPETISRAGIEATAFHETWPGHHLQVQLALARPELPPVLRYLYFHGMGEGWALYTERLADEMGLYSGDVDRLGMLSNEALRAARLVVDPGMHALGWTREAAIRYMLEHTAESEASATSEVDRYIAVPAQATAYLVGSLEIRRLRRMAEERLGEGFDIRVFHDEVLDEGTVTLGMLREDVERWVEERAAAGGPDAAAASRAPVSRGRRGSGAGVVAARATR